MEHSDEQLEEFKADFARRKRNQIIAAVPVILLLVGFMLFEDQLRAWTSSVSPFVLVGVAVALFVAILGFSLRNWRCPACNGYLGRTTSMNHCPKCGVALK